MKRTVLLITLLLMLNLPLVSQTFSFKPDTTYAFHEVGLIQLHGTILNLTGRNIGLRMIRTRNILPENWESSLCVGLGCYPAATDTVEFTVPGESEIAFYLDVTVDSNTLGRATIDIYVENRDDTSENIQYTYNVENTFTAVNYPEDDAFILPVNFPNPFNPVTRIRYYSDSFAGSAVLTVFNSAGQMVYTQSQSAIDRGFHFFEWNGMDQHQQLQSSGIYFYTIHQNHQLLKGKMSLIR